MEPNSTAATGPATDTSEQANAIFETRLRGIRTRMDVMFAWVSVGLWAFAMFLALTVSPYAWEGKSKTVHIHVQLALVMGAFLATIPFLMTRLKPGTALARHLIAANMILWSALLIHLTGGRIETHFFIFGCLAWLAFYLDWKVIVTATLTVCADHLARGIFYPESVYGIINPEWWRFLEHAFWVIFEDSVLIWACILGVGMIRVGAEREAKMIELSEINENKTAALELMIAEFNATNLDATEPEPDALATTTM